MTQSEHRAPLAPGEIRTHIVGDRAFRVAHTGGGMYTQASYRHGVDGGTVVICTDASAEVAVKAYADAIEAAEAAGEPAIDFNLPMGADSRLVYGDEDTQPIEVADEPVTPLEAIAVLRRWAEFQPNQWSNFRALAAFESLIKESL